MNVHKILFVFSVFIFIGCAQSKDFVRPGTNFNKYQRIAVMPLVDYPRNPQSGVQVADMISMHMMTTGTTIMDRSQTSQLLSEQKLGASGLVAEDTAPKIGRILGVQAIITGSINEWSTVCNNVQFIAGSPPAILCTSAAGIALKLIDTETGQIVWAGSARGSSIGTNNQPAAADKAVENIVDKQLTVRFRSQLFNQNQPSQISNQVLPSKINNQSQPSAEEWFNKAGALFDKNTMRYTDTEKAIEYLNQAILLNPDHALAYFCRGYIYGNLMQHQRAIEDFTKSTRLNPDFTYTYLYRGLAYLSLGMHERAIDDYTNFIRLEPNFTDAYATRGSIYSTLGQYNKAKQDFDAALRIDPNHSGTHYNYACLFSLQKDATQACKWLESAIKLGFNDLKHLKADKDFGNIRNEKCFADILTK